MATPEAALWVGCAQLSRQPGPARTLLAEVLDAFGDAGNQEGVWLAWSMATESFFMERDSVKGLDGWIERHAQLIARFGTPAPGPALLRMTFAMVSALSHRDPRRVEAEGWSQRAAAMLAMIPNDELRLLPMGVLLLHFEWMGFNRRSARLLDKYGGLETGRCGWLDGIERVYRVMYLAKAGDFDGAARRGADALAALERSGLHALKTAAVAQVVIAYLGDGRFDEAESLIRSMMREVAGRAMEEGQFELWAGMLALERERYKNAWDHMSRACEIGDQHGFVWGDCVSQLVAARVAPRVGVDPRPHLERGRAAAGHHGAVHLLLVASLTEAWLAIERGDEMEARTHLDEAVALAVEHDLRPTVLWTQRERRELCEWCLSRGLHVPYFTQMARIQRLTPAAPEAVEATWPWPVRAYVLGAPRIEVDGEPLTFERKVPRKPLALLHYLIVHGPEVSEAKLLDALWPDADGDAAAASLKTTLARLRKLVGPEAVRVRGGRIALNEQVVWSDYRVVQSGLDRDPLSARIRELDGPLLPDDDAAWLIGPRRALEQLRGAN